MDKKRRKLKGYTFDAYALIAPSFLVFFLFTIIPLFKVLFMSFTDCSIVGDYHFVGLENFKKAFSSEIFWISLKNTAIYAVITVTLQIVIGLLLAVFLNSKLIKMKKIFRGLLYVPNIISMVAVSMIWLYIFEPTGAGLMNRIMRIMGASNKTWLSDIHLAMGCIIAVSVWKSLGYIMTVYLAGLQQIPSTLYEAARIDGASPIQQFKRITVPLLSSTTFFLVVTSAISAFSVFEQVNIMTSGGPINATTTLVHQIYTASFMNYQTGYGSALSVILIIILVVLTIINYKVNDQNASALS